MFVRRLQIQLPRRITAYFLLFGLAALVWLSVGAVFVARSVTDCRSESASLRALGHGCNRVVLAHLRDRIELVLDGGASAGGAPSTVLDVTVEPARVLRAGAVRL